MSATTTVRREAVTTWTRDAVWKGALDTLTFPTPHGDGTSCPKTANQAPHHDKPFSSTVAAGVRAMEPTARLGYLGAMTIVLPPSLDRAAHSIGEEVAHARSMSPEERLALVDALCRAAWAQLMMHPHRDRLLQHRDPLPESSRRALARLKDD